MNEALKAGAAGTLGRLFGSSKNWMVAAGVLLRIFGPGWGLAEEVVRESVALIALGVGAQAAADWRKREAQEKRKTLLELQRKRDAAPAAEREDEERLVRSAAERIRAAAEQLELTGQPAGLAEIHQLVAAEVADLVPEPLEAEERQALVAAEVATALAALPEDAADEVRQAAMVAALNRVLARMDKPTTAVGSQVRIHPRRS